MIDPGAPSNSIAPHSIAVAKLLIQKAVYYIDNVDSSVMREFVTGLSVQVLSLFETKPRRHSKRQSSSSLDNGKAFRLCINKDHRDRLLDDSRWPAFISISEWFFKPADGQTTANTNSGVQIQTDRTYPTREVTSASDDVECAGEDTTMMLTDHSQPPSSIS